MIWMPRRRIWRPDLVVPDRRHLVGAARAVSIGAGGSMSPVAVYGSPGFTNVNSTSATWNPTITFATSVNAIVVLASWEQAWALNTVEIDPDGTPVGLSALGAEAIGASGVSRTQAFAAYSGGGFGKTGSLTVRLTFAGVTAGAVGIWLFENATRLPTTGDYDEANGSSLTSIALSLDIEAGEEGGIICAAMNGNLAEAVAATGGLTDPELHYNSGASGGQVNAFSDMRGSLSGTETPGFSWTTGARASCKGVLVA